MFVPFDKISGPALIALPYFPDKRGSFQVSWNDDLLASINPPPKFCQDNLATSHQGVVRGLHFQAPQAQAKFITVMIGEIFDVILDLRKDSPTFGYWSNINLSANRAEGLWIPKGFAHGYQSLSPQTIVAYKVDAPYRPDHEYSLDPMDHSLGVAWPEQPRILSKKDQQGISLQQAIDVMGRTG